jgi:hypothetical protein
VHETTVNKPDVRRGQAGVGQRRTDGLLAERHGLGGEPLHAGRGAPGGDVLGGRVDDAPAGVDAECSHTLRASFASA